MILYQKLYDIDKNSHKTISKSLKPVFKFKKRNREEQVKNEIKSLAQIYLFLKKYLIKIQNTVLKNTKNNINNHKDTKKCYVIIIV